MFKRLWQKIKTKWKALFAGLITTGVAITIVLTGGGDWKITIDGETITVTDSLKYAWFDSVKVEYMDSLLDTDKELFIELLRIGMLDAELSWILLVNNVSLRPGINRIGDVIAVNKFSNVPSIAERQGFDVVMINNGVITARQLLGATHPDLEGIHKDSIEYKKYRYNIADTTEKDISKSATCNIVVKEVKVIQ